VFGVGCREKIYKFKVKGFMVRVLEFQGSGSKIYVIGNRG